MDEPIPKISIQDLSTLLGAALGGPVRAADLHDAVLKPRHHDESPQPAHAGDLIEQLLRGARRQ
ncbi:hypothetical protein [Hydrocarboniphaga sp.]|uniref:hypothetical protein n=1 Tax=Hydrocarboniphaga sp. TaxID=2033016 RepID=UPI003D12759E